MKGKDKFMKKKWQGTAILLAAALLLVACGTADATAAENAMDMDIPGGTHEVVDHAGNHVEVPDNIERVVIDQIPILSTYMAYFEGSAPYMVGYCGSFKDTISETVLKNIAPELLQSQETVYAQSDLNIEEIIKLEPDVILYNAGNAEHAEILKASGIPAIGFATVGADTPADPLERYEEWLKLLENIFGEQDKMDEFLQRGDEIVAEVKGRIAAVPEEQRPTAMILYQLSDGVPQVAGQGVFGYYWLEHLGVQNVAEETQGFVSRFTDLIDYLLPLYSKEGKSQLVIAVGCTGGHHRSVALAQYMCDHLTEKGVTHIKVVPYFLFEGIHIRQDIPEEIEKILKDYPGVTVEMGKTLGVDERLADILVDRILN